MFVTPQVKARVEKVVAECVQKANKHFGRQYRIPRIEYTVRGRVGGYARGEGLVNFNPVLLMENIESYMTDTVPHEVAHCIDSANGDNQLSSWEMMARLNGRRIKRQIHGDSWKRIMRMFGCDPERCHNYDVKNAAVKNKAKFEYLCQTCKKSFLVSSVLHNRMQRGQERWCRACGRGRGTLVFAQGLGKVPMAQAIEIRDNRLQKIEDNKRFVRGNDFSKLLVNTLVDPNVSIVDRARKIYGMYSNLGRGVCIRKMVEIGVKENTASTYYQNFKAGK
jgi:SprT protein